jgi:hypothetical protein
MVPRASRILLLRGDEKAGNSASASYFLLPDLIRSNRQIMQLEEFSRYVVEFVRGHEDWAAPIVFALAFAESLAFLSLILPCWAALVAIGAVMRTGGIEFVPVWIAGGLGAAFGDWLSYWLGVRFKKSIGGMWHSHVIHTYCPAARPSSSTGAFWQSL